VHRFYWPPEDAREGRLRLRGREAHHARNVLRIRAGDRLVLLDGAGSEFLCQVSEPSREELRLALLEKRTVAPLPWQITLLQAVPKGKLMEAIIQKATELGVARIVPLRTERVVGHIDGAGSGEKAEKWRQVAVEAIKQCGAAWLPQVEAPLTLQEFLGRNETFELPLVASLQGPCEHPRRYFQEFETRMGRKPRSLCVWVGPEGDFTPSEMHAIKVAGNFPITLGSLVLRTETAALCCLSILNYELQSPTS
jgi:16S rRNA (uracil1498-N3)-methyltransferase